MPNDNKPDLQIIQGGTVYDVNIDKGTVTPTPGPAYGPLDLFQDLLGPATLGLVEPSKSK